MKKWKMLGISAALGAVLAVSGCGGDKQAAGAKQETKTKEQLVLSPIAANEVKFALWTRWKMLFDKKPKKQV